MPQIRITEEVFGTFVDKVNSGASQVAAARQLGFSKDALRSASDRLGLPMPSKETIKDKIAARLEEIKASNQTQAYWAKHFGVSQARIATIFKQLGIKSKHSSGSTGRSADYTRYYSNYKRVLAYISEHGGYVTQAIKALGITCNAQEVRDYAALIGFDLSHYQFAYQSFGNWLTLPGPWVKKPPQNYEVPAVCLGCGEVSKINLCNARMGKTKGCLACATADRKMVQVLNVTTGEVYRSIMTWVKAINRPLQYQKLRLRLTAQQEVEIDGVAYRLINTHPSQL